MQLYQHNSPFYLESGAVINNFTIAYHTYGTLNTEASNVIWICHALTANSNVKEWWPALVGENALFDTSEFFIVCANIIGSCYGSTGPLSTDVLRGEPYYSSFPFITIRDMVTAHQLLAQYLGIKSIALLAGGSMGGYQAIEWAVSEPNFIKKLFLIATSAQESPWGIAIHAAQRLAIEADDSWLQPSPTAGAKGLKAARAIGMITYRSYESYAAAQKETDNNKQDDFKAASYINYQGNKLANRFNAYSYWLLTKAMDSHNIARSKNATVVEILNTIKQPTFIMGINSDLLCPAKEQVLMSEHIPNAQLVLIDSLYGHDGFLIETSQIIKHLGAWLKKKNKT